MTLCPEVPGSLPCAASHFPSGKEGMCRQSRLQQTQSTHLIPHQATHFRPQALVTRSIRDATEAPTLWPLSPHTHLSHSHHLAPVPWFVLPTTLFTVGDSSCTVALVLAARSAVPSWHSGSTVAPGVMPSSGIGKYLPSKRRRPWWWLGWTAASGQPRWIPGAGQGSWEVRVCGGLV